MFADRVEAGARLAEVVDERLSLLPWSNKKERLIVVGLPRGGVPVALELARRFCCPLEVIVSKKLPYPGQPEFAIGAVSSDGVVVLSPGIPGDEDWQRYIENERQRLLAYTRAMENGFYERAGAQKSSFKDMIVIIVDDGIATGMTAMAAAETVRRRGAFATIIAAPVMSADSYRQLRAHCDQVIAVTVPRNFTAVGQHYLDFSQTSNDEVVSALRQSLHFGAEPHTELTATNGVRAVG